jgi:anti-sigma regulatory factor (Ser/Thr protein kinase)
MSTPPSPCDQGEQLVWTSPQVVRGLFARLAPELAQAERAGLDTGRLRLVLDEVVSNSYRHGYRRRNGEPIRVRLQIVGEFCHLEVRDEAPPFDSVAHSWERPDPDPTQGKSGGMGLVILRQLCDSFTHDTPAAGGNRLCITLRLTSMHVAETAR